MEAVKAAEPPAAAGALVATLGTHFHKRRLMARGFCTARRAALAETVMRMPSAEALALVLPQWGAYTLDLRHREFSLSKAEVSMVKGERATQHNALLTMPPTVATRSSAAAGGPVSSALCCVARSPFTMLTSALGEAEAKPQQVQRVRAPLRQRGRERLRARRARHSLCQGGAPRAISSPAWARPGRGAPGGRQHERLKVRRRRQARHERAGLAPAVRALDARLYVVQHLAVPAGRDPRRRGACLVHRAGRAARRPASLPPWERDPSQSRVLSPTW